MSGQSGADWADPSAFTYGPPLIPLENIRVFAHHCVRCQRLVEAVVAVGSAFGIGWCRQCMDDEYGPDDDLFSDEPSPSTGSAQ